MGRFLALAKQPEVMPESESVLAPSDSWLRPESARLAVALFNEKGVRLMLLPEGMTIGIWSDLDCSAIRAALQILGKQDMPVLYLDAPGIPEKFKVRAVPGQPVSMEVLREMECAYRAGWKQRDKETRQGR